MTQIWLDGALPRHLTAENIIFVCVGTDRSTGDALGPLVGMHLQQHGYDVRGTIDEPVHAMNLEEVIAALPSGKVVVAVDACLGQTSSVGRVMVKSGPIRPGAGVDKELPAVGDYSIAGIVNVGGFMEHFVLQNTRLSFVMKMAEIITDHIKESCPRKERVLHAI